MSGIALLLAAASVGEFSVSASPPSLASGAGSDSHTTASTTVTPTGGTGPFTYSWAFIETDGAHTFIINAPAAQTTNFTINGIGPGDECFATANCEVTDTATSETVNVEVPISHLDMRR